MEYESGIEFSILRGNESINNIKESESSIYFENTEIELGDFFSEEELEELEKASGKSTVLQSLPTTITPQFVTDDMIPHVVEHKSDPMPFRCANCGKLYKKNVFYSNHIRFCGREEISKPKKQTKESMTSKQRKKGQDHVIPVDEDFVRKNSDRIITALTTSKDDPINCLVVEGIKTPGNEVAELSHQLLNHFIDNKDILSSVANDIVSHIVSIYQKTNFRLPSSREEMWASLLSHVKFEYQETSLYKLAKEQCNMKDSIFSSLYYKICEDVLLCTIKHVNEKQKVDIEMPNEEVSNQEKQVIYYVAGYIIFSLKKHYQRLLRNKEHDIVTMAIIDFLKSCKISDEKISGNSFPDYVQDWTKAVNRGYLVEVKAEFYVFIETVEKQSRKVLNVKFLKSYKNEDLRDALQNAINESNEVNETWLNLTRDCPNENLVLFLKQQMISKWIDIRANSFVKSYVQVLKRNMEKEASKKKLAASKEHALRKEIGS